MFGFSFPFREFAQTLSQLLTAGTVFGLEVAVPVLPAVVRESQKVQLGRLLTAFLCVLTGKAPKLDASRFILSQLQPKSFEPIPEPLMKAFRIVSVLMSSFFGGARVFSCI